MRALLRGEGTEQEKRGEERRWFESLDSSGPLHPRIHASTLLVRRAGGPLPAGPHSPPNLTAHAAEHVLYARHQRCHVVPTGLRTLQTSQVS